MPTGQKPASYPQIPDGAETFCLFVVRRGSRTIKHVAIFKYASGERRLQVALIVHDTRQYIRLVLAHDPWCKLRAGCQTRATQKC